MGLNLEAAMRLIDEKVLEIIQAHCDEDGNARISLEDIAEKSRSSPATVKRATKRLADVQLIEKSGSRRRLTYRIPKRANSQ